MNITDSLRALARERPDTVAFVRPRGGKVTLHEFDRQVDHLARQALAVGIEPGDVVMVAVERPLRLLQLELALARIGAAAAPPTIDRAFIDQRLIQGEAPAEPRPGRHFVDAWFDATPLHDAPVPAHPDPDAASIVFASSGTTGTPKAIPVTHAQMAARIAVADAGAPLPSAPRTICLPRASSGAGFVTVLRVLFAGGTIVSAATPEEVVAAVERFHVNNLRIMPVWIERLVAALPARGRPLAALEKIEVGGAALSPALCRIARERLCEHVFIHYAATETGYLAGGPADQLDLERGDVGQLAPGVDVEAFDEDGVVVPRGADGLLRVRAPGCATRYLGLPEASLETFVDGWIVLPDVGRVGADGNVILGGRASETINVGGYKVNPRTIEDALLSLDVIEDAAVFGVTGANGTQQLCAAIVLRGPVDRAALDARLRERLGNLHPSLVMQVKNIPRNENGKILRHELVSMAQAAGVSSDR